MFLINGIENMDNIKCKKKYKMKFKWNVRYKWNIYKSKYKY